MSKKKSQGAGDDNNVVPFPTDDDSGTSSTVRIFGRAVYAHGYTGLPNILVKAQGRLKLRPVEFNLLVQLLSHWYDPARPPFPSRAKLAERMSVTPKSVTRTAKALEDRGLLRREIRQKARGNYDSNVYHLDGLIEALKELVPDFDDARAQRRAADAATQATGRSRRRRRKKTT